MKRLNIIAGIFSFMLPLGSAFAEGEAITRASQAFSRVGAVGAPFGEVAATPGISAGISSDGSAGGRTPGAEPWQEWAQQPVRAPLVLMATAKAEVGTQLTIGLAGQNHTIDGVGCGSDTPTNRFYTDLKPYFQYTMSLSGPNWAEAKLSFVGYTPRQLLSKQGYRAIPRPYKVFINGKELPETDDFTVSYTCGNHTTNLIVELRPDRGFRPSILTLFEEKWTRDEDQETEAAPGDGSWAQIGPGRAATAAAGAFRWAVSLGRLRSGFSAGKVRLIEQTLSEALYTGMALTYTARSTNTAELHVITNANGSLRQIRAPQALLDIQTASSPTQECVLRFYILANVSTNLQNGVYLILTNSPFVTWRIRNPDAPGTYNRLQIVEQRPAGRSYTQEISYTAPVWKLVSGTGTEQRSETRTVSLSGNTRQETIEIKSSTGSVLYKAIEKYNQYPWGWELTNVVTHPDGNGLTNSFVYWDDPNQEENFGRLKQRWHPGGRWELFFYRYYDEYGQPQCDGWPFASFADYPYAFESYLREIRMRPWKDGPVAPASATLQNVIVTEIYFDPAAPYGGWSRWTRELAFDSQNQATLLFLEEASDNDLLGPEPAGGIAKDASLHGELGFGYYHSWVNETVRFRQADAWYNDLLWRHNSPTHESELFEYAFGFFDWNTKEFTVDDDNGTDFQKTKTIGLDNEVEVAGNGVYALTPYPTEKYWDTPPWTTAEQFIVCVQGKTIQEITIHQGGNPVYSKLLGVTNVVPEPLFAMIESRVRQFDSLGHLTNEVRIDARTGVPRTVYEANWRDASGNDTELKGWEVNELGERLKYAYDSHKRLQSVTRVGVGANGPYPAQSDIVTNKVFNAAHWLVQESITAGGLSRTRSINYDAAGRVISETSFEGITNTVAYSPDTLVTTVTHPGGLTKVTTLWFDGRLRSITGTAVVPEYHDYVIDYEALDSVGPLVERVSLGTSASPRWSEKTRTYFGAVGVERRPQVGGNGDPVEVTRLFAENAEFVKELYTPATVIDQQPYCLYEVNNWLFGYQNPEVVRSGAGSDERVQANDIVLEHDGTDWFRVTYEWVRTAAATTRTNTTRERLTGFTSDTVLTDATITDPNGNVATVIITLDRVAKKLTAVTNTPQSTINITGVTINGLSQSLNTESISTPTYFYYDALGRPISEKDPLGFVSGRTYDTATGWVTATTNAAGKVTTYQYYQVTEANSGKLKCQTDPNGKKSYTQFNNRGQLKYVWGDVPYPEERVYDDTYGDMIRLRTFRDGSNWSNPSWPGGALTPDETVWTYDPSTGVVLTKQDAAGRAYANTYHPMGILATRQWARGVTITYTLNVFVEPLGKQYSDGTPGFTVSLYTSLGQPYHVIDDAFGTLSFAYDEDGEQLSATYGWDSPLAGVAVTNRINSLYGKDQVAVDLTSGGGSANLLTQYDFDPTTGRLATVSRQVGGTTESVSYSYLANSDLINSRVGKHGTSTAVTANQGWEYGYRLRSTQARLGTSGPLVSSWTYVYDDVDRRQAATLVDGSTWQYGYDDRNQVISGARFWADFVPVAGQQFGYAYDSAGNRGRTTVGGDASGQGLRSSTYTTNNLNQYTSRTVPGAVDVVGYATAPASVTVNGQAAYEKGEYFWKETTVANGSAPQSVQVDVVATQQGNSASDSGRLLVPKATQSFSYDFDGNLTFDGIWQYEWDAENRPKAMTMTNLVGVPNAQRFRLELGYDWLGRRLAKTVKTWTGTEFANPVTTRFVYDLSADQAGGWRLLAELDADNNIVRSYTWGLDLSGTLDDAGGIAGLLFVTQHPGLTTHFACYDGNGNVVALVDTTSTVSARYEYGPFGEPIGLRGAFAETNPIRWSTKYMDAETELVCYGNRYYSPSLGRWISRDPIEEQDGNNLYAYVGNNPVNGIDPLGQLTLAEEETVAGAATTMGFSGGLAQAAGVKAIAAYTVFEISLASYDLYETMDTIVDPDASLDIKTFTVVGAAIGAIAPGGFYSSASKNAGRYLFNTWHKATFDSKLKTIMYHLRIHGKGRTAMQYTQDAMNFFNKNKHLGQKVILKDGTPSIRIQTKLVDPKTGKKIKVGGLWTESGQLVTYWD